MAKFLVTNADGSSFEVEGTKFVQDGLSQRILEDDEGGVAWSNPQHNSSVRKISATSNEKAAASTEGDDETGAGIKKRTTK